MDSNLLFLLICWQTWRTKEKSTFSSYFDNISWVKKTNLGRGRCSATTLHRLHTKIQKNIVYMINFTAVLYILLCKLRCWVSQNNVSRHIKADQHAYVVFYLIQFLSTYLFLKCAGNEIHERAQAKKCNWKDSWDFCLFNLITVRKL